VDVVPGLRDDSQGPSALANRSGPRVLPVLTPSHLAEADLALPITNACGQTTG
jgi:hypothetical protein